jgi:hypothetical protein
MSLIIRLVCVVVVSIGVVLLVGYVIPARPDCVEIKIYPAAIGHPPATQIGACS